MPSRAPHDAPGRRTPGSARVRLDRVKVVKILIWIACLAPLGIVVGKIIGIIDFGPHPVQEVLHSMGKTGLNLLLITLAITPLRKITKQNWLIRLRRLLGLFAFFYVVLHLLAYAALDLRFDFATLGTDIAERPYITIGTLAILLLIPLAVTSTRGWQRRLGRNWTRLHKLVYVSAVLGVIHFWWQVKADIREPLLYALILGALLGFRAADAWRRRRRRTSVAAAAAASR
ncbi:MAG: protein-methionine-sulfoxide reductase heme-binding subunit MsrQ [Gammaproteobacteria bacterium]|nr:sulfoxide reductase heme-binding subunit YedZ [Gammaproteobacteria bacterium]